MDKMYLQYTSTFMGEEFTFHSFKNDDNYKQSGPYYNSFTLRLYYV